MRKSLLQTKKNRIKTKRNKKVIRKPGFIRIFLVRFLVAVFVTTFVFAGLVYVRRYLFKEWLFQEAEKEDEYVMTPDGEYTSYKESFYRSGIEWAYESVYHTLPELNESFKSMSDQDRELLYKNSLFGSFADARLLNSKKTFVTVLRYDNEEDELRAAFSHANALILCDYMSDGKMEAGVNYLCRDEAVLEAMDNISKKLQRTFKPVTVYFTVDSAYIKDDFTFVADKIRVIYYMDDIYDYMSDEFITLDLPSREEMEKKGYTYYEFETEKFLEVFSDFRPEGVNMVPSLTDSHLQPLKLILLEREKTFDIYVYENYYLQLYQVNVVYQYYYLKLYAEDGKTIWPDAAKLTNFEILRRDGIILYVFSTIMTLIISIVTYLKRKSIYELDTYRRELTNVMAHDLKTPLMVLRGNAENLVDVLNSDEEDDKVKGDKYAVNIMTNVDYMTMLINKTLMLSSLESGVGELEKKDISIREVLGKLVDSSEAIREQRDIDVDIIGNDIILQADEFWICEAFRNLIDNAAKYADEGSTLKVKIKKKQITVSNKAKGLTEEDMKTISNPFSKKDKARSGKKGSGLGLTIVKNIFELHGWKMKTKLVDDEFVVEIRL